MADFNIIYNYRTIEVMFEDMDHDQTMEFLFRNNATKNIIMKHGFNLWKK